MNERELISKAQEGDDGAFGVLLHAHLPRVYRFVLQLVFDPAIAEDAAQETFIRAWKNVKKFDADRPFLPWLLAIARNAALDLLRKKKTLSFSEYDRPDEQGLAETIPDPEPLPEALFAQRELATVVRKALETLPLRDREILSLRYEEGLSFEEIAGVLRMPANTARSIHRRALIRLRKTLS